MGGSQGGGGLAVRRRIRREGGRWRMAVREGRVPATQHESARRVAAVSWQRVTPVRTYAHN